MSVWDSSMAMCMPLTMPQMPMKMLMVHGNLFGTQSWVGGPRGNQALSSTQMVMIDTGTSLGDFHYLNLDIMLTAEKWTVPVQGYPLLLQIGDRNQLGTPYIDAQHPHSSPIMGITLSDTLWLGHDQDHLKLSIAPRGETTDGPIAFPHRATGIINPDAPLGHHIGQDVGHISSTVLAMSLKLSQVRFELSIFHDADPPPDQINLPIGLPDSISARFIYEWSNELSSYLSVAKLYSGENRYSASTYFYHPFSEGWTFYNTLIWGMVTQYDPANSLSSFTEEFLVRGDRPRFWGRIEVLQRTSEDLAISSLNPQTGLWVSALTLGYTHNLSPNKSLEMGLGGSITQVWLPREFSSSYGGNPWSGKIFLQLGGMKMDSL